MGWHIYGSGRSPAKQLMTRFLTEVDIQGGRSQAHNSGVRGGATRRGRRLSNATASRSSSVSL